MEKFHQRIKKYLWQGIENGKIPHAQLFLGSEGSGILPLTIEYASKIISKGNENSEKRCKNLLHPDMHFFFPNTTNEKVAKEPRSELFLDYWRKFCTETPFGGLQQWYKTLEIEKKQGSIGVNDARDLSQKLSLRAFEAGEKVVIVWMAELMSVECSNKILKILEEPPKDTKIILISENKHKILPTIYSRCQVIEFSKLSEREIEQEIQSRGYEKNLAKKIALRSQGNFNKALNYLQGYNQEAQYEQWFLKWIRTAYKAKGNKSSIMPLIELSSELASVGREMQKSFLDYCSEVFREAMLINYGVYSLSYLEFEDEKFSTEKLSLFVHSSNIQTIQNEIEKASFHIERNGNAKAIFTDLSIKLTRLIHTKM